MEMRSLRENVVSWNGSSFREKQTVKGITRIAAKEFSGKGRQRRAASAVSVVRDPIRTVTGGRYGDDVSSDCRS